MNSEIDTLEKLVEVVGKRMQYYHNFKRELVALRKLPAEIEEIIHLGSGPNATKEQVIQDLRDTLAASA